MHKGKLALAILAPKSAEQSADKMEQGADDKGVAAGNILSAIRSRDQGELAAALEEFIGLCM